LNGCSLSYKNKINVNLLNHSDMILFQEKKSQIFHDVGEFNIFSTVWPLFLLSLSIGDFKFK